MFGGDAESDFRDFDIILTDSFIDLKGKNDFILTAKTDGTPEQSRKNLMMKTVYDILQSEKQIYAAFTHYLQYVYPREKEKGRSA